MKSILFIVLPSFFLQITNSFDFSKKERNPIHFKVVKNSLEISLDTSEYEEEIIYKHKKEIAKNVYNFQRRTVYNTEKKEVNRIYHKKPSLKHQPKTLTKQEKSVQIELIN